MRHNDIFNHVAASSFFCATIDRTVHVYTYAQTRTKRMFGFCVIASIRCGPSEPSLLRPAAKTASPMQALALASHAPSPTMPVATPLIESDILERRFNRDTRVFEYHTEHGWNDASHFSDKRLCAFHEDHTAELAAQIDSAGRDIPAVEFHRDGYTILDSDADLDARTVATLYEHVTTQFNELMTSIARSDKLAELLKTKGFANLKLRHRNRYDLALDATFLSAVPSPMPWLSAVQEIMGATATLQHFGCMISLPGSETQSWHRDGPENLLNVFVPLIDVTRTLGGTQLYPGSQGQHDLDIPTQSVTALLRAGQCLLFDYRIKHRGLANHDIHPRPVLYFTYAPNEAIRDEANFSTRRYAVLPPIKAAETRDQRMRRRRRGLAPPPTSPTMDHD